MNIKHLDRGHWTPKTRLIAAIGVFLGLTVGLTSLALAQSDTSNQPAVRASQVGHATRAWLDLQSSNSEAAPPVPMLGAEAGLAYRRYLESFKSKIPDLYESKLSGGGSQSNSGSGSGSSLGSGSN